MWRTCFSVLIAVCIAANACAGEFVIRDTEPAVGSHINRMKLGSPMPFDKRYDELTPDQRKLIRSKYINLGEEDEPPYPESGYGDVSRQVSRVQEVLNIQGLLTLTVRVNAAGEGVSVSIYETPDERASQAVAFAAMKVKYKPAKCAGVPCEMDFPYSFNFTLR